MAAEAVVPIATDTDILLARQKARAMAGALRFTSTEQTLIATAISEVARNILNYAKTGEVVIELIVRDSKRGLCVTARDRGPGIADIERAMTDGYSTSGGMGLGLPGAKRLMDEFHIVSAPGRGTIVTMTKWEV